MRIFCAIAFLTLNANLANLRAVELSSLIPTCTQGTNCTITTNYGEITNNSDFRIGANDITINANIGTFINYGSLIPTQNNSNQSIAFGGNGHISNFINYGYMERMFWIANNSGGIDTLTNYGIMGGIKHEVSNPLTLNNLGIMRTTYGGWYGGTEMATNIELGNNAKVLIQNYALRIDENTTTFNSYGNYNRTYSHLVITTGYTNSSVTFKDKNSRIYLDFGLNFELGKEYAISKIAIDTNGNAYAPLGVDFSRLSTYNDIYSLTQSGDNFVVSMNPQYGTMGMLYKSNVKTMNNLFLQSNNMIYPHKYKRKKFGNTNPNTNPRNNNYRRVRGISNLFMNPHNIYATSTPTSSLREIDSSIESMAWQSNITSSLQDSALAESWQSTNESNESKWIASSASLPRNDGESVANPNNESISPLALLESNELFFYDNEWLLARDNANARKVNMDYTHSVKAVNNSNVSKDAYYNKGAYRNKIITNDTRTNEINQYQSTNRAGNVSRSPNQNNRHLANQSNNSPCGSYKCIYIYKPKQQTQPKPIQPQPKVESKPKVVEQPKVEQPKPQPKPIQAIRPTMPPPPKIEPKIEQPKPVVQPKPLPKVEPKIEPKAEPKVVKVESPKPTPPKPKVIIQDPYYFILTPYIAHNFFYESGRYNVSGLEYGFITAFSGKITEDNILGLHFAFSYGSLKDSVDSIFNITAMNIMGGLNYKFDIRDDMYLKARVDIFYFLNQVQSTMTSGNTIKPNNLGFGASVAYGKEWDFDRNGILGLEVALDYKGLMGNALSLTSYANTTASYVDSYDKALYNMLYVDLGVNYDKYFESSVGRWGLDSGLGIRGNITANALAKSKVSAHNNARVTNMTLDNDRFIAYLNIGGSYLLERKDFDMEFSLAYYGNFGDRTMSNAGGFEWRVWW